MGLKPRAGYHPPREELSFWLTITFKRPMKVFVIPGARHPRKLPVS